MEQELDPYQFADNLSDLASDLMSDITSLTVHEVVTALKNASRYIEHLADVHYSYVAKTKVTLAVGGQELDLTDDVLSLLNTTLAHEIVREAIYNYVSSSKLGEASADDIVFEERPLQ